MSRVSRFSPAPRSLPGAPGGVASSAAPCSLFSTRPPEGASLHEFQIHLFQRQGALLQCVICPTIPGSPAGDQRSRCFLNERSWPSQLPLLPNRGQRLTEKDHAQALAGCPLWVLSHSGPIWGGPESLQCPMRVGRGAPCQAPAAPVA